MESSLHVPTCPPSAWLPLFASPGDSSSPAADSSDSTKAQGRLLLFILCSVGFSAACILLCCWACLASCLSPHLSNSRPLAPGPLHFSGYSRVPDGKPLVRGPYCGCAMVPSSGQMLGSDLGTQISRAEYTLCMNQAPTEDWLTVILALELCEEIVVCGMVSDSDCGEKSHLSVPQHYFEKGWLDRCQMYLAHEQTPRSAHRFTTEKAVFSRGPRGGPSFRLLILENPVAPLPSQLHCLHQACFPFTLNQHHLICGSCPCHMPGGPRVLSCPTLGTLRAISGLQT